MDPALQNLIDRLNRLSEQFKELREGVRKALDCATVDPEMALIRSRKVLEYVVRDVFVRRVQEPPGTRPLENLIQRLVKDGHLPPRLEAYTETIRKLGNVGAHHFGERVSAADVYQSLTQLMPILEWYFEVERPDAGVSLNLPHEPRPTRTETEPKDGGPTSMSHVAVVPKGLRSFDANDKDFFLQLLPGPRDKDGLPESIRFWKHRIEATDELSFTVGVIYGPSGCGKSSLMKAGLLPRLAKRVVSVYIEATADDTDARLLNGLRRRLPDLPGDLDLCQTLVALRQGQGLRADQKVVIVLDQFEQWLHAHRQAHDTELARSLRQCDGDHVQSVLMVRDDFWMALTRFMSDLHIELLQGQNAAPVDLFDLIHARRVLAEFGKAFGRLPDELGKCSKEQSLFLDQAIEGLAQDGRVISIRLALFAEMVKGKPWTPTTLKEVGGAARVAVAYLEETFASASLRSHQKAASAVLKSLLPQSGSDIKGHMRSHEELLRVSGYSDRPNQFGDLLRTLDGELRLITPTDPEGSGDERPAGEEGGRYYQLSHDFLVPSLRDWLTRKQKETRRGRAELRLAERSSLWSAKPENRHLPSLLEWANIRLLTRRRDWSEPQRRMMRKAGWIHGSRALATLILLGLLTWGGIEGYGSLRASSLVDSLRTASTTDVPALVRQVEGYRRWANPRLLPLTRIADETSREKLHASLALLPVDTSQLPFLEKRLLITSPTEFPVLRDALEPHRATLVPKLWSVLESAKPGDASLLPAAGALADYDPDSPQWEAAGVNVAQALVTVNPVFLAPWLDAMRPVRGKLNAPLAAISTDKKRSETERTLATNILTDYARDDPDVVADLLMDAEPKAYAVFFPLVQRQETKTLPRFQAEIAKRITYSWNDPPLDPSWATPDASLTTKFEAAQGLLTERLAFCQTMSLDEFVKVAEALRPSGYRPTRFRPYADGKSLRVAVVWTRDGRPWRLVHDLSTDEIRKTDERNRKEGYIPVDVAGFVAAGKGEDKSTSRFAALWAQRTGPDDDARMVVASSAAELTKLQGQMKGAGLVPLSLHAWRQPDDRVGYSSVWHKKATGTAGTAFFQNGLSEGALPSVIAQQAGPLIDLGVSAAPPPLSTRERAAASLQEAEAALKAKPDDVNARFARAWAHFQLGENQKSLNDINVLVEKALEVASGFKYRAIAHARLGHKDEAKADLERFQKGDNTESTKLYLAVIVAAELGEGTDQALEALEAALKGQPQDSGLHFDAACAYALASQALAGKDRAKSHDLSERAIRLLGTAIENGYDNYELMQEDTDLDPLRDLPAFVEIMRAGHLDRSYAAVWTGDVHFEASPVIGLEPTAHLQRCRELASQGYRMVSLSVARTSSEESPVTASIWHRPVITQAAKDRLAERQARAAVALYRLGKVEEVPPLLRHSADPRLRSFIINWLEPLEADPKTLAAELDRLPSTATPTPAQGQQFMDAVLFHPETSMRRALILVMGTYGTEGLSPGEREPLIGKLLDLYRNDPDGGVHGAAAWTLRQWGQQERLLAADAELMQLKDRGDRRWFVNSQGQTFAVIEGPVEFRMGSPLTEPDRHPHESLHRVVIPRRFAIADREITVAQYQRFVQSHPQFGVQRQDLDGSSPDPDGPMIAVTWYGAAAYCNWLSEQEGLPKDQWCYLPNPSGAYDARMSIPADVLKRRGYRLATEAEWEYACRAGTITSRYYGQTTELLGKHAWYFGNSRDHAWAGGRRIPNDLGLFDMLGNVYEWVQDRWGLSPTLNDNINTSEYLKDRVPRLLRGGTLHDEPAVVRSAGRIWSEPTSRYNNLGFRPARTYY
jgi:formylglycine-generating enzyme required for sulfatase activity/tetratricopeptide (TPR) repeat protein